MNAAIVAIIYLISCWFHYTRLSLYVVCEGEHSVDRRFVLLQILDLPLFPTEFVAYITSRVHKPCT